MIAFWAILLIVISIRLYWKHSAESRHDSVREAFFGKKKEKPVEPTVTGNAGFQITPDMIEADKIKKEQRQAEEAQKLIDKQKNEEIERLRKQGYSDELIAIIIPTINNGE